MSNQIGVIDSFAWIEYFAGSSAGLKAKTFIENVNGITPTIVVAELSEKYRREKLRFNEGLMFIAAKTRIVALDSETAEKAGALSYERKRLVKHWGLGNSIVLATARKLKARVVTGDEHFRDLIDEVIMIT
jgi:PIN domain nuclease of toxin-antitoxin system